MMAILKCPSGEVEIRLQKPFLERKVPNYFDEFDNVRASIASSSANRCTTYIISEDTYYAIEVTLKKGFHFGSSEGVRVKLYDKATDNFIGQKMIEKIEVNRLPTDHMVLLETVSGGIVDGRWIRDTELMFQGLSMDENLDQASGIAGLSVASLGGLRICFSKYFGHEEVTLSPEQFAKRMAHFEGKQISKAQKIDESSFNKNGITHAVRTSGGSLGGKLRSPTQKQIFRVESEKLHFEFICRSKEFIENENFLKCPLPLELKPWVLLTEDQCQQEFKTLQERDKERVLAQRVAEAGLDSNIEAIKKDLFEKSKIPKRWKAFSSFPTRDLKAIFITLQERRLDFEQQIVPPARTSTNVASDSDRNGQVAVVEIPFQDFQARSSSSGTVVESQPLHQPSTPEQRILKPGLIVIEDIHPNSKRQRVFRDSARQSGTRTEPIDLDTYVFRTPPASVISSYITPEIDGERATKKPKLDHLTENPKSGATEIRRLRLELQRRKEELEEAEKLAKLRREAEELESKIEELEESKEEEKLSASAQLV